MQRMKDVAKFQQELEKKKSLEEQLRRQAAEAKVATTVMPDSEMAADLDLYRKKSLKLEGELTR